MKRNWKVDNTREVGTYVFWHGDPERLPAPWVHRCFDKHPWNHTVERKCPSAYRSGHGRNTGLCVIQRLDNLQYLEYKLEQKEQHERDSRQP